MADNFKNNSESLPSCSTSNTSNFLTPPPPPHVRIERSNSLNGCNGNNFPTTAPPPVPMRSMSHEFMKMNKMTPPPLAQINSVKQQIDENVTIQEAAGQILSSQAQLRVNNLLHQIEQISDIERFYLYLQLPTNVYQDSRKFHDSKTSQHSIKKSTNKGSSQNNTNVNGLKTSQQHTIDQDTDCILTFQKRNQEKMARQWIQDNLQLCEETSLARKDVYEEYEIYIRKLGSAPLLQSDFGKVMRLIFPEVKSRRLGARGSSKYCYAGLRKRTDPGEPSLPMIGLGEGKKEDKDDENGENGDGDRGDDVKQNMSLQKVIYNLQRKFYFSSGKIILTFCISST